PMPEHARRATTTYHGPRRRPFFRNLKEVRTAAKWMNRAQGTALRMHELRWQYTNCDSVIVWSASNIHWHWTPNGGAARCPIRNFDLWLTGQAKGHFYRQR